MPITKEKSDAPIDIIAREVVAMRGDIEKLNAAVRALSDRIPAAQAAPQGDSKAQKQANDQQQEQRLQAALNGIAISQSQILMALKNIGGLG